MKPSKVSIIFVFILISAFTSAQEIIATGGDYFLNFNGSVSFTIGEPVNETFTGSSRILTQGFQQSNLESTFVEDYINPGLWISVAPNPVVNILKIWISDYSGSKFYLKLISSEGVVMLNKGFQTYEDQINFDQYAPGFYMLSVSNEKGEYSSFKIIKY